MPRSRNACSARSTCANRSEVTSEPYGILDARQGAEGCDHVDRPRARERTRISSLVSPASASGEWTPWRPGEPCGPIDDVEVHENDRLTRLIDRKLVALAKPETAKAEEPRKERTSKR